MGKFGRGSASPPGAAVMLGAGLSAAPAQAAFMMTRMSAGGRGVASGSGGITARDRFTLNVAATAVPEPLGMRLPDGVMISGAPDPF
jgi:hypothetical protein